MSKRADRAAAIRVIDAFDAEIVEWTEERPKSKFITVDEMSRIKAEQEATTHTHTHTAVTQSGKVISWSQPSLWEGGEGAP